MSPQIGPASPEPVNRRGLESGQDWPAGLKIAERETLVSGVDESRHDPGPHVELLDREDLTDGQASDPMAEGDPRAQIRCVARRSLVDQRFDLGRGDADEEIAIDRRELRGESDAVQVPHGDAKVHPQQSPQLRRASVGVLAHPSVVFARAIDGKHAVQETAGFSRDRSLPGIAVLVWDPILSSAKELSPRLPLLPAPEVLERCQVMPQLSVIKGFT